MGQPFNTRLRDVRRRCDLNVLLDCVAQILLLAAVAAALAVLSQRLLAVDVVAPWTAATLAAVLAVLLLLLWVSRRPSRMQVALIIDDRLALRERISTALALAESSDPFAQAAVAEAHQLAGQLEPHSHFPVRPSRRWCYPVGSWLLVGVVFLLLPQYDLLGRDRDRRDAKHLAGQREQAAAEVKQATVAVKTLVNELGNKQLADQLAALGQANLDAPPDQIKRDAIKKLTDLADELEKMQNGPQLDAAMMQQMLKQLRTSGQGLPRMLNQALAQGDMNQARKIAQQMAQQLQNSDMSAGDRKDMAQQLQELAKKLEQIAQQQKELEEELERQGLDKKLAKMSEKEFAEACKKQGMSQEQIDQLLQKKRACQSACSRMGKLAQACGACGSAGASLSAAEINELAAQLSDLEAAQQQLALTQAALDELRRACAGLGKCQGLGLCSGSGPWKPGDDFSKWGRGTGGPGRGQGARDSDDSGNTNTQGTRVTGESEQGAVIASWLFKGDQVKGQSQRDLSNVVQAAKDAAAQAITENEIPRRYEDTVKKYFGQLEDAAPAGETSPDTTDGANGVD